MFWLALFEALGGVWLRLGQVMVFFSFLVGIGLVFLQVSRSWAALVASCTLGSFNLSIPLSKIDKFLLLRKKKS